MNKKIYNVVVDNSREQQFNKEVEKLEKKANKIGCDFQVKLLSNNAIVDGIYTSNKEYQITLDIDLKIPDYKLVGINKLNVGEYIYITIDNTIEVPKTVKNTYICNHCNTNRKRKMYYIFHNEKTNNFVSVGSTCCKEYFGIDIEKVFKKYDTLLQSMDGYFIDNEIKIIKTSVNHVISKILAYDKINDTNKYPYKSYKSNLYECVSELGLNSNYIEEYEYYLNNETELKKEAGEIIEYVLNMENKENSEYINNLKNIFKNEYMDVKFTKYILYSTKLVAIDKFKKQPKKEVQPSNYIGEIKDKVELELTLYNTVTLDGFYGISYIYLFKDKQGNIFKWVTNTVVLEDDRTYTIKGTIKAHEEYKGTKQNVLTRCKVVGYEEQEIKECNFEYKLRNLFDKYNKKTQIKYRNLIIDRLIKLTDIRKVEKYDCICFLTEIVENYSNKECDINKVVEFLNKKDIQNYMKENNIL